MEDSCIPKDILYGELTTGQRVKDLPQLRYKDFCKQDMKAVVIKTDTGLGRPAYRLLLMEKYPSATQRGQPPQRRDCQANSLNIHYLQFYKCNRYDRMNSWIGEKLNTHFAKDFLKTQHRQQPTIVASDRSSSLSQPDNRPSYFTHASYPLGTNTPHKTFPVRKHVKLTLCTKKKKTLSFHHFITLTWRRWDAKSPLWAT